MDCSNRLAVLAVDQNYCSPSWKIDMGKYSQNIILFEIVRMPRHVKA